MEDKLLRTNDNLNDKEIIEEKYEKEKKLLMQGNQYKKKLMR